MGLPDLVLLHQDCGFPSGKDGAYFSSKRVKSRKFKQFHHFAVYSAEIYYGVSDGCLTCRQIIRSYQSLINIPPNTVMVPLNGIYSGTDGVKPTPFRGKSHKLLLIQETRNDSGRKI